MLLGGIVLAVAAFIAATPFAAPRLDAAVRGFDSISVGVVIGSFVAALALFAVPVTLLGAVSPFAIKLALTDLQKAGTIAGRLYAVSTVGSIIGTFVAALVAIQVFGTQRTMVGTAVLLAGSTFLLIGRRAVPATIAASALLLVPAGAVKAASGLLFERESPYQYVSVIQWNDGTRVLQLNEGVAYHSMWRRRSVLTGQYWDLFAMLPPLLGHSARDMLVIGNAGGTIARMYGPFYPAVRIDGVELDPAVTEAGRRFLGLDENPRLHAYTADGRPFLARNHKRYDLIVVDAYRQPYVPFYLATREFFALARRHLRPGGILALNVAKVPGDDRLIRAVDATLLDVFPQVWRWPALRFNDMVFALDRPAPRSVLVRRASGVTGRLRMLLPLFRWSSWAYRQVGRCSPTTEPRGVAHRPDVARADRARARARRGCVADRAMIGCSLHCTRL